MPSQYFRGKPSFWTAKRLKMLGDMYRDEPHLSAQKMAARLGKDCTRNMVIGMAGRRGLVRGDIPSAPEPIAEPEPPKEPPLPSINPEFPNRCVTTGCRNSRQKNLTGLCAECTKDRLARQGRDRADMRQVNTGDYAGNY